AHRAGQPLRATIAWDQAQLHLRLAQLGILAGIAQRACHRQLQPSAQGEAVDRAQHRDGEGLDPAEQVIAGLTEGVGGDGVEASDLLDVGTSGKRLRPGAGEHNAAQAADGAQMLECLAHFGQQRPVQGVELFGAVQRDAGQRRLDLKLDGGERGHAHVPAQFILKDGALSQCNPASSATFPSWPTLTTARAPSPTGCSKPPARSPPGRCSTRCWTPWTWSGSAASPSRRTPCASTTAPGTANFISST